MYLCYERTLNSNRVNKTIDFCLLTEINQQDRIIKNALNMNFYFVSTFLHRLKPKTPKQAEDLKIDELSF